MKMEGWILKMKRLRFDNDTLFKVEKLVANHDKDINLDKKSVRREMNRLGADLFPLLLLVKEADISAQSDYHQEEKQEALKALWKLYDEICEAGDCVTIKDLAVNGKDLIEKGIEPGPRLGEILSDLLDIVIDDPSENTKEKLLNRVVM